MAPGAKFWMTTSASFDEFLYEGDALGFLHIDGDAPLAAVEGHEAGGCALVEFSGAEATDVAPWGFDGDDVGAEAGEHHGAVGSEPDVCEV